MTLRKTSLALALCGVAALVPGCYGQFALTRKIYGWNGHATGDKFANSAIMWALIIIPVYEVASFADFLLFNTIEVLTGRNPIAANGERVFERDGHRYVIRPVGDESDAFEVEVDGALALRYQAEGDAVVVTDPAGVERARLPLSTLARMSVGEGLPLTVRAEARPEARRTHGPRPRM